MKKAIKNRNKVERNRKDLHEQKKGEIEWEII